MNIPALIDQITHAFANVQRQDGVTLHQAIALDNYAPDDVAAAARKQDTDTHWTAIPRPTLQQFESALSFMDVPGTRYYLPAFMIAALEGHIHASIPFFKITRLLGSVRTSPPDQVAASYGFDWPQCAAIAAFLRFVVGDGRRAESQAELQLVYDWEAYVQTHGIPDDGLQNDYGSITAHG